ncbi:dihydrofolate reductase family protein [Persicitalea jodogahamensis]|uniref:Deaminase n=1 Tax=Persicitalea jodogahamensis TaxID=402147 RepID=A0A8J3G869_9BACT|nr:dihydrofolate reductase family protein [Persicitalea jodogahamensis]GHB62522.1 deaminase [Persicitalea jodogahamensis]
MRKLKLQVQISVDGYVAGPNGEMDWMVWGQDTGLEAYVNALTDSIDTILLGRNMTDGFVKYWTHVVDNQPESREFAFAKKMVETPKVVFTKTLEQSPWANTSLAKGNLEDEVNQLKNQEGDDIIVYGGSTFVSSLIAAGLIDEYHLFVNPVALGSGMSIFGEVKEWLKLTLVKSQAFDCGEVVLCYVPR